MIGSVGRLEPQKRFDLLIEAFGALRRTRPDLRLVIAGEGSQRAMLSAMVTRLGLESHCLLAGHRPDVVDVLHAFDLFVHSSEYEGTPNAVLEAMAVEAPVVATTSGGTEQLITHGVHGLLVPINQPGALAAAIEEALSRPDAMATRAQAARARIEGELSFRRRMQTVERIYEQLAHDRPTPARSRSGAA